MRIGPGPWDEEAACSTKVQQPERPLPTPADRYSPHWQRKDLQGPRRHWLRKKVGGSSPSERAQVNGPLLAVGVLGRAAAGLPEQLACI
jgi:hypothetical protein